MNAYRMHALKQKKDSKECYCALCRSPRVLRYGRHLSKFQYFQIALISAVVMIAGFPFFDFKMVGAPVLVWIIFESVHKSYYRRDLACPFCGFDPTWYKKDVKLARRKVEEFLAQNTESNLALQSQRTKQKLPSVEKNFQTHL